MFGFRKQSSDSLIGQLFQPTAFRSDIKDIVKAMFPLFWGVRRG